MSSKVQPILMEDTIQTATSSVPSTASPKVSLFSKKSGFVIPKNKLSGSLVPIYRGSKKPGGADVEDKETTKQVLRKTKWGPDLTQDAFVKKGRASAYQTRLEQITQQLKSGILEGSDDQDSTKSQTSEKLELLELERREIISEILKLNPSYKAPADYKPLLKEDKVVIPIKEYPERNFIEVIFAGDTIKRLEKETGAKIRVYGRKADTKSETEITTNDGNEVDYEELSVDITAETYDKVDNAVSLIELLITPVPAPDPIQVPVSEDVNPTMVSLTQDPPTSNTISPINQPPPLVQFPRPPDQWQLPLSAPPFPNLSVSAPIQSQPPPPLHRPPNMNYPGPPRNPMPPVQVAPRQQNFPPPNMGRPGWSQPPQNVPHMIRPPPPPPVRSIPPPPSIRPPPMSNDFTFQTHRPPPPPQFMPPPQPPSFRMQQGNFHRPHNNHQFGGPDRRPDFFPGHGPPPPPAARQFGPGNFGQAPQNHHHPSIMQFRPQNFVPRGNVPPYGVPRQQQQQQIYDPFSASGNSQSLRKQESDPEYDDLMASVGLK